MAAPGAQRLHQPYRVPLADACVTEWRRPPLRDRVRQEVPLADACVTEWRSFEFLLPRQKYRATR